jgi:hypothetical protein
MGADLGRRWVAQGNDLAALPDLAIQIIEEYDPSTHLPLGSVVDEIAAYEGELPRQRAGGRTFGQPPLTLWNDPDGRFFIEMYLWSCTDMTIHDHPFTGAFTVLDGECTNEVFTFHEEGGTDQLRFGHLDQVAKEDLRPGNARAITNGTSFIHRNLHLSRPTVTFIMRTLWDGTTGLIYDEAGMALDPSLSPVQYKQLQFLEGLLRLPDPSQGLSYVERVMQSEPSPSMAYQAIDVLLRKTRDLKLTKELVDYLDPLLGAHRKHLSRVLETHVA